MLRFGFTFAYCVVVLAIGLGLKVSAQVADLQQGTEPSKVDSLAAMHSSPTVLYGAAYYNEYMPGDQAARLDTDVALMKAAGLNVVRVGESTWSLWEPEDGQFDYAWMDRIVDAMGKAGIKVILGTPTYSIPAWMAHQHPEMLARRMNGGQSGIDATYGMRQNMDTD